MQSARVPTRSRPHQLLANCFFFPQSQAGQELDVRTNLLLGVSVAGTEKLRWQAILLLGSPSNKQQARHDLQG